MPIGQNSSTEVSSFLGMENWQLKLVIKHADHRMRQVSNSINGQDKKKITPREYYHAHEISNA